MVDKKAIELIFIMISMSIYSSQFLTTLINNYNKSMTIEILLPMFGCLFMGLWGAVTLMWRDEK